MLRILKTPGKILRGLQNLCVVYHREVGALESSLGVYRSAPALVRTHGVALGSGCGGGVALVVRSRETGDARFQNCRPRRTFSPSTSIGMVPLRSAELWL
jgi:hypothetical protein